jgi:hypothetical protein
MNALALCFEHGNQHVFQRIELKRLLRIRKAVRIGPVKGNGDTDGDLSSNVERRTGMCRFANLARPPATIELRLHHCGATRG